MSDPADNNVFPFPDREIGPAGPSRGQSGGGGIGGPVVETTLGDGTSVAVYPDNSVSISVGAPETIHEPNDDTFDANLAERMEEGILSSMAEDTIEGVLADIASRSDLIDQYEKGIDLLGTRIEDVSTPSSTGRSVSRIGHPLLTETMVKFHAGSEAEMLPAEGPAKVMTVGDVSTEENQLAQDFESDLNYYLTEIAEEYYPDTSGMLMHLGYCGNAYKKVFYCAMRGRPVSDSISMLDLIVSEEAKTLQSALRVTHQIQMTKAEIVRMQIAGGYRDIELGWSESVQRPGLAAVKMNEGLAPNSQRPEDMPYVVWETDRDLDLDRYPINGKWERAAPRGLPLPYKITIDVASRKVLSVRRNWKPGDKFYRKNNMYVRYGLVPWLGFHHIGFLQLLGNHTRALRAIWRLMIDSGMFGIFPGGIKLRGTRTATNEIAPNPGEWIDIDAPGGNDITKMIMPLPYKQLDAVFIQLAQIIEEGAQRLGGTVMIETGEGKVNVPVGSVMAMIEQTTQVMAGVHRRTHRAQKEELRKIRDLFVENPKDLWQLARDPKREWEVGEEFSDLNLVPASDPSIPSQTHRIMRAWALGQIAQMNPELYDMRDVHERLLRTIREPSPDTVLLTPDQVAAKQAAMAQQGQQPPPQGGAGNDPTKVLALQQKGQLAQQTAQQKQQELAAKGQQDLQDRQLEAQTAALESADRAADRASHERIAAREQETERMRLEAEAIMHPEGIGAAEQVVPPSIPIPEMP